ncbi:SulP family inorganic anion transporter [soil metagenome]
MTVPTRDLLAGAAVAGIMLPEAVAYAGIAGLAPSHAIAAAVAGGLGYAALGRSRYAIVAPTSSSAAILAAALAALPAVGPALVIAVVGLVAAMFGAAALFRLGGLAGFVSRPVLRGFAFGLAVTIIVRQLPAIAGVKMPGGNIARVLLGLAERLGTVHVASLLVGAGALLALLLLRRFKALPGPLIVLAAGVALASLVDLPAAGVALTGSIPLALSWPTLPALSFGGWAQVAQLALPIALILFAESWGTMRSMALRHGDTLDANRELGALGLANLASALVVGMPVGAGFSVGSANDSAGATSRLSAVVAALGLAALILFAAPLVARIPEPLLAAIVIAALTHALAPAPFVRLFRLDRDQGVAIAAALGVLAFGVLNGMLAAILLSLGTLLRRFSQPTISELGRVGTSHDFVDIARHPEARKLADVALFRPNAPLFFANAETALGEIARRALARPAARLIVLSLEESSDLDSSATEALGEFVATLAANGRRVVLARAHDAVRDVLAAAGMDELARGATFSVADAVAQQEETP